MTILTKPSNDKKAEKVPLPLALDDGSVLTNQAQLLGRHGADVDAESMIFNRPKPISCVKSLLLFILTLLVTGMGVLGGYTLYRMWVPTHAMHYRALCDIPYMSVNNQTLPRFYARTDDDFKFLLPNLNDEAMKWHSDELVDDNFFREDIELDMEDEDNYAKVNVPDFKEGRQGKFMHDFKQNQSAIIDSTTNRCFIMPLDRETTLPPRSFIDLMEKMGTGYYNIDTNRVRRTMRVVTPAISDMSLISDRIANECEAKRVYMLENYVSGVFKREAKPITEAGKFAEFLGKGIIEYDLMNIADIDELESEQK